MPMIQEVLSPISAIRKERLALLMSFDSATCNDYI